MRALPLAESATLGALLLDNSAAPSVTSWLRASDFADPWHRDVYRSLRELLSGGGPAGATEVGRHMVDRLGPARADLTRVAALLRTAPTAPDPRHFAAMVLEAAIRRETPALGVLLRAGALAATTDAHSRPMVEAISTVEGLLDASESRWASAGPSGNSARPGPARPAGLMSRCLAADRFLQAHPEPHRTDVAEREATLVVALLTHPAHLPATAAWLRPTAMANPTWRRVYKAMLQLDAQDQPIDVVSVLWETQRSSRRNGPGPEPATVIARTDAALAADPRYWARLVAGDHLRLAADNAADGLRKAAANPGLPVPEVLGTGRILTGALRTAAQPLHPHDLDRAPMASVQELRGPHRAGPVAG